VPNDRKSEADALRVVLVDDDVTFLGALRDGLAAAGRIAVVACAHDVDTGVDAIERHSPHVAVVDGHMPGGGGTELTRRLRRGGHRTAVVVLSAHDDGRSTQLALESGADAFVAKGGRLDELIDLVARLARR